ncbi:hypothetical protein [Pararhizobium sp. O133]|uniref:hypothetical protein n=1 Tax=Pararhizobium sp. O133 TaxID=3449278 RepID=UPI003F6888DE
MRFSAVKLAGATLLKIIVPAQRLELFLHDRRRFHDREDAGDSAVDFQRCRLVAWGLANYHLLDELAHDVDKRLLRFRISVFAHLIEGTIAKNAERFLDGSPRDGAD